MTNADSVRAAAAAGALASEDAHRQLLQSIVNVARAIFDARASSIFLLDEEADELVIEAVSGEGEGEIVGLRFPSSTGIAGWVLVSRQPLIVDDVSADPRWARNVAERTGYVPKGLMAVPLLNEERTLGVLYVLDRRDDVAFTLAETDLLGAFANQAALGLELLLRARRARAALEAEGGSDAALVSRLATAVTDDSGAVTPAGRRLLESLAEVLEQRPR
jgi:GAF domain-containing protein